MRKIRSMTPEELERGLRTGEVTPLEADIYRLFWQADKTKLSCLEVSGKNVYLHYHERPLCSTPNECKANWSPIWACEILRRAIQLAIVHGSDCSDLLREVCHGANDSL